MERLDQISTDKINVSQKTSNISKMKQEIDQDWELNRLDDTSRDINPYRELIVINAEKTDTIYHKCHNGQYYVM